MSQAGLLTGPAAAKFALGPGLVGAMLNFTLFGCLITQTYFYVTTYQKDSFRIKCFVCFILAAGGVNAVFDLAWVYQQAIGHFGDSKAMLRGNWVLATDPVMLGIIAFSIQIFFAWRIKILTENNWIFLFIVVTAVMSFCGALGTTIALHFVTEFVNFYKFNQVVVVWLVPASICDVVITVAITTYLRKNRTGFSHTDHILKRISRLAIQNGLITTLWSTVNLLLYLFYPSGLYLTFNFALGQLYTNTLMFTLNARDGWMSKDLHAHVNIKTNEFADHKATATGQDIMVDFPPRDDVEMQPDGIFVHVECHEMVDIADEKTMEWMARSPEPQV